MKINTNCERCLFSDIASSKEPCKFDIINHIGINKNLKVVNDYYYIDNYQCQYCLSKEVYLKNKDQFDSVDVIEYIKQKVLLQYYLIIDCNQSIDVDAILSKIMNLSIAPKFVSFIVRNEESDSVPNLIKRLSQAETNFIWKIHDSDKEIEFDEILKSVLDTNIKICKSRYIWIRSYDQLMNDNDEISIINYLVNIKQDSVSVLCSSESDTIHSCFLNIKDYEDLITNVSSCLYNAIKTVVNDKKLEIGYYD